LKADSISFDAAKSCYQNFRRITSNPSIPVAFVEVIGQYETFLVENPEIFENGLITRLRMEVPLHLEHYRIDSK
jgi:hypothetical protein